MSIPTLISNTKSQEVIGSKITFITIGDQHLDVQTSKTRLERIRDYVNNSNIDFAVMMGDITDGATKTQFKLGKSITDTIKKKLFVIIGNHDAINGIKLFESYYGHTKHIELINGFQLIFIGIQCKSCLSGGTLSWDFNFNDPKLDKKLPTIVFIHGPPFLAPHVLNACTWGNYFGYAMHYPSDIRKELGKFTNIRAIYAGHCHWETEQVIDIGLSNGVHCITNASLITRSIGCHANGAGIATDFVGLTEISDSSYSYKLVKY